MNNFKTTMLKARFGIGKRISFYRRLMSFTEQGFAIYDTLVKFKKRMDSRKDFLGEIIGIWIQEMKKGKQFYQAVDGWIPASELNLIAAGEKGEGIHVGLREAIRFTEAASRMKSVIVGGAVYPLVLLCMALFFLSSFSSFLSPVFSSLLPINQWPDDAQFLQAASAALVKYWYVYLAGIVVLGYLIKKTIGAWTGPVRRVFDNLPPWSIYKSYNTAAFLITLSSMMSSGTPLNDSLKSMSRISSRWMKIYLERMMLNLKKGGRNFGVALDVGLMDTETAGDVIDYSELSSFERAIALIGEQSIETTIKKITAQMAVARNLMLVVVVGMVGWIYLTVYTLNTTVAESATSNRPTAVQSAQ